MASMRTTSCEQHDDAGGMMMVNQRVCASERVHPGNGGGRGTAGSVAALSCRRAVPSKWDDAERWITSPVNGNGGIPWPSTSHQQQQQQMNGGRMPKSKSGPLALPPPPPPPPQRKQECSSATATLMEEGGWCGLVAEGLAFRSGGGGNMGRSASLPLSSEKLSKGTLLGCPKGEKRRMNDAETTMRSCLVSRRDVATQMSPKSAGSATTTSSTRERSSFSPSSSSAFPSSDPRSEVSSKFDMWEATISMWSRKNTPSEPKNMSKFEREEGKIIAWENLQKAKAQDAIRELEVKLEKKRSRAMKKIMKKLTAAHNRAQEMRNSISDVGFCRHPKHARHKAAFRLTKYMERVFHC